MAATDAKRKGLNNQRRGVDVVVTELLASSVGTSGIPMAVASDGSTVATLPPKSLIVGVEAVVTVASASSDTIDVTYGGNVVCNEISVDALGGVVGTVVETAAYSATGGDIVVKDGSQATDANFRGRVIVRYVELDRVTGMYTE